MLCVHVSTIGTGTLCKESKTLPILEEYNIFVQNFPENPNQDSSVVVGVNKAVISLVVNELWRSSKNIGF